MRDRTLPLLTTAGYLLTILAQNPDITIREAGEKMGVGESVTQRAVSNLVYHGLVRRDKTAYRNRYVLDWDKIRQHTEMVELLGLATLIGE